MNNIIFKISTEFVDYLYYTINLQARLSKQDLTNSEKFSPFNIIISICNIELLILMSSFKNYGYNKWIQLK